MAIPWLRLLDGVLGATDILRLARRASGAPAEAGLAPRGPEPQIPGLMLGALREVFDRDRERLDIERQRMEEEKQRAERALRLELYRQAGEREVSRLRGLAAVALVGLLAALVVGVWLSGTAARAGTGAGGLLLIGALLAAFNAQARVARALDAAGTTTGPDDLGRHAGSATVPWLVAGGLACLLLGVLLS